MTERELQRRLRAAAVALDGDAPLFETAILRRADRRRARRGVIALAAVIAVIAAPVAVSALGDL